MPTRLIKEKLSAELRAALKEVLPGDKDFGSLSRLVGDDEVKNQEVCFYYLNVIAGNKGVGHYVIAGELTSTKINIAWKGKEGRTAPLDRDTLVRLMEPYVAPRRHAVKHESAAAECC